MSSITMRDPVDGSPVEIKNPLRPEHIEVGRLLWYSGITSTSSWDCPAVITQIDEKGRFRVRSLDDMREQDQWYEANCTKHTPSSRQSMRLVEVETIRTYLEKRRQSLLKNIQGFETALQSAKDHLERFDTFAEAVIQPK